MPRCGAMTWKVPPRPVVVAGGAADDLRQHRAELAAARDHVAVVAMRGEHVVLGPERGAGADAARLLADIDVIVPADQVLVVGREVDHLLLGAADREHLREVLAPCLDGVRSGLGHALSPFSVRCHSMKTDICLPAVRGRASAPRRRRSCLALGTKACSSTGLAGTGANGAPIRWTGASSQSNAASWMRAAISRAEPALHHRLMDDERAVGALDRAQHRVHVERREAAQVDHLGRDAALPRARRRRPRRSHTIFE